MERQLLRVFSYVQNLDLNMKLEGVYIKREQKKIIAEDKITHFFYMQNLELNTHSCTHICQQAVMEDGGTGEGSGMIN